MKNRIFLVSLVAMFVSSNMPDAYGETPEVPAYLVTWSASASDSKTYNASRLCFEYTMDASLNTNWFGTMVVGSQGHVLDILQEYNLDSQYDEQEERIGPCFCQDSTIYHLSSRSLSGKDETGGFGAYVDEWITPDDRHVSVGGLFYQGVVAEGFDYFSYGGCYWIDLGSCVSQCDSDSYSEPVPGGPPVDFAIELTQFHIEATDPVGKHFSVNTQIPHLDLCVGTPYWDPLNPDPLHHCALVDNVWSVTVKKLFDPLVVHAVEVTQAIQDWDNSVPLVEGKKTYVRAFITTRPEETAINIPVNAQLRGYRNGVELNDSPLKPITRLNKPYAWSEASLGPISKNRRLLDSSTNFSLPAHWRRGTVTLVLERLDGNFECQGAVSSSQQNCLTKVVTFEPVAQPEIAFFMVDWTDSVGNTWQLSLSDIKKLKKRLVAVYPISGLSFIPGRRLDFGIMPNDGPSPDDNTLPSGSDWSGYKDLLVSLQMTRLLDGCTPENGCNRIYYGALPEGGVDWGGLASDIPSQESWGTMLFQHSTWGHNRHAHEIGHNLGLHHAVNRDKFGPQNRDDIQYGACCEVADGSANQYPEEYFLPDKVNAAPCPLPMPADCPNCSPDLKAFISKLSASDPTAYRSYGLNTHSMEVADPEKHFELMSYCGFYSPNRLSRNWEWSSDITYKSLMNRINETFGSASIAFEGSDGAAEYVLVAGKVALGTDAVVLWPFTTVTLDTAPAPPTTGEYALLVLDSAQNVLNRVDFELRVPVAGFPAERSNYGTFMIPIPADPNANQIQIVHNEAVLASRLKSQNTPTVDIIYPNAGAILDGPTEVLSWTANDGDGDPLIYTVQYSADGGDTWETLTVDWLETTYEAPMGFMRQTTTGRIRVLASDGFNVGEGISEGYFSVPNHAPSPDISSPGDDAVFAEDQLVSMEGSGVDLEDGVLPGTSLVWRSDVDGVLGTGRNVYKTAYELSEGYHVLTLTSTDSRGGSASESVQIRVVHQVPPGLADIAVALMGPSNETDVGEPVIYHVSVRNNGPDDATGIMMTGVLDETFDFVSAESSQGSCTETEGTVKCDLGDLAGNDVCNMTITGIASVAGVVPFTVNAYGEQADPMMVNNEATYDSPTCEGDMDNDRDVDGFDLAKYATDSAGLGLDAFATDFGKTSCP